MTQPAIPFLIQANGRYANTYGIVNFERVSAGGAAWPANNRAIYVPLAIPRSGLLCRFFVVQDGNQTGTNDVGLFSDAGVKLASTGAQTRTLNTCQFYDVSDYSFAAGHYYIGLLGSSTTGTYTSQTLSNAALLEGCGVLQEDVGAATLPATMTPVAKTSGFLPMFGFTQSNSI